MSLAAGETRAVWLYFEGPMGPTDMPDEYLAEKGLKPEDYFAILRRHSAWNR